MVSPVALHDVNVIFNTLDCILRVEEGGSGALGISRALMMRAIYFAATAGKC